MTRGRNRTRFLQVGMTILLIVCCVQVLWWILDEAAFVATISEELLEIRQEQAMAAATLGRAGLTDASIGLLFPGVVRTGAGQFEVAAEVREEVERRRYSRTNRYGWEGTFFLLVLVVGMGVIGSAVRQEARARQQEQDFLAVVSHELKTPLAGMRLSAETIALRDPPTERRQELVRRILGDVDRLESMVLNVLDVARLEHEGFDLQPEQMSLASAVAAAMSKLRTTAVAACVTVDVDVPEEIIVMADPDAVRTVAENLVGNAIKATALQADQQAEPQETDAGPDGRRVQVSARRDGGSVLFQVTDDGVGFEPRDARRIFEKFYRASSLGSGPVRGSGLGLYLVRRLAEGGGGSVRATSPGRGQGATFEVRWPAGRAEGAA